MSLIRILRHSAIEMNIPIRRDGYVKLDDLRKLERFKDYSLETFQEIVDSDDKQRFKLIKESLRGDDGEDILGEKEEEPRRGDEWMIRANQGHSMKEVDNLGLYEIKEPLKECIHKTNKKAWKIIEKEGLSRMKRNHIHLSESIENLTKQGGVYIYIDTSKALKNGIRFFRSDNNVILSPDKIDPAFFSKVKFT